METHFWPGPVVLLAANQVAIEAYTRPSPEVSLDEILAAVSAEYGVSEEDLRGTSRNRVISEGILGTNVPSPENAGHPS